MPETPTTKPPLTIWLTDRTRYTTGTGRCRRDRFLTNHFGPTGYGIVRKGDSLPLATGSYAHKAAEPIFEYLRDHDQLPPIEVIRGAVTTAVNAYKRRIEQRGYGGILQSERGDRIVLEQCTLIEGMIHAFCRTILPWMHQNYRILEVEREGGYMLDCSCGLGAVNEDPYAHDALGCTGVWQMLRQDCIAERRVAGGLAYFEIKTTGWAADNWASQWETRPQLAIGNFGIQERHDKAIVENWIIGLYKGRRAKVDDPYEGTWYRQESPLCMGYCRPGNPPLATDDWLPEYEYLNAEGEKKRVTRAHVKRGVWELVDSDWPAWTHRTEDLSPAEFWINQLPVSTIEKSVFLVGPLNRQDVQGEALKRQIAGEEKDWQRRLWELYNFSKSGGFVFSDPEFQAELDRLFPASWDCRRFGARSECQHKGICFRESGWEDPLRTGRWVPRRPHHALELEQAVSRGLLPEHAEEEDEDEY